MKLSEKIFCCRKKAGLSQEEIAQAIGVSRQSISQWETGTAYPDISNLIQLSDLFSVTVDYLVREQDCMLNPLGSANSDTEEILAFRLRANLQTYAAFGKEVPSTRLDSHDFRYEEGRFAYHDTYIGGEQFAGQEAVWRDGKAVYAMNYMGRVLGEQFSGNFLKEALRAADKAMPYRGPKCYQSGQYVYQCKVTGDADWFHGLEEIFFMNQKVYECSFSGLLLK